MSITHSSSGSPLPGGLAPHGEEVDLTKIDVLDQSHVGQLRSFKTESGRSLFYELTLIFRRDGPARIARIKEAIELKDSCLLGQLAHASIGSASSIGARQVQFAMRNLETASLSQDWARIAQTYAEMDRVWKVLWSALEHCDQEET